MRELFRGDWYRALKSGMFWLGVGAAAAVSLLLVISMYDTGVDFVAVGPGVPGAYLTLTGLISAVVCGVNAEWEFVRGTIRNKLVAGHTRRETWIASYMTTTIISYAAAGAYLGILYGGAGAWAEFLDTENTLIMVLEGLPAIAAFTAMYSLVGVIWRRKGAAAACVVVFAALFIVASWMDSALMEQQYVSGSYAAIGEGSAVESFAMLRNPYYIAEPTRSVYQFLNNFLPTGQAHQLAAGNLKAFLPTYSLAAWGVFWVAGIMVLDRSDIR